MTSFRKILAAAKAKREVEPCQHDVEEYVPKTVNGVNVLLRVCARCFIDLDEPTCCAASGHWVGCPNGLGNLDGPKQEPMGRHGCHPNECDLGCRQERGP